MYFLIFSIGIIIGLMIGVFLGAQIIDEKNKEIKYLRRELGKSAQAAKNEDLF